MACDTLARGAETFSVPHGEPIRPETEGFAVSLRERLSNLWD